MERGSPEYEERLYKYSRRGFYVSSPYLGEPLSLLHEAANINRLLEHRCVQVLCHFQLSISHFLTFSFSHFHVRFFKGRTRTFGLALLTATYRFPYLEDVVDIFQAQTVIDQGALPYGPNVTAEIAKEHIEKVRTNPFRSIFYSSSIDTGHCREFPRRPTTGSRKANRCCVTWTSRGRSTVSSTFVRSTRISTSTSI